MTAPSAEGLVVARRNLASQLKDDLLRDLDVYQVDARTMRDLVAVLEVAEPAQAPVCGQWEQYVGPALLALWRERFGPSTPVHEFGPEMQECVRDEVRAVLAAVGPLIAEDTRDRLVAAAGRVVEREVS